MKTQINTNKSKPSILFIEDGTLTFGLIIFTKKIYG